MVNISVYLIKQMTCVKNWQRIRHRAKVTDYQHWITKWILNCGDLQLERTISRLVESLFRIFKRQEQQVVFIFLYSLNIWMLGKYLPIPAINLALFLPLGCQGTQIPSAYQNISNIILACWPYFSIAHLWDSPPYTNSLSVQLYLYNCQVLTPISGLPQGISWFEFYQTCTYT